MPETSSAIAKVPTGTDDLFEESQKAIKKLETDEIVIGLCAPIGSPVHTVAGELKRLLEERYGYECNIIRLSHLIEEMGNVPAGAAIGRYERKRSLIDRGNELRRLHGHSVLADLAIAKIASDRESHKDKSGSKYYPARRVCYILDSIKNQDELDILRRVYRGMFYFIGVFAPLPMRVQSLQNEGMELEHVYKLIDRDSGEEIEHGQTVRGTFPQSDFFVRGGGGSDSVLSQRLQRFLDLILRASIVTPTAGETAMYQAASAAGNSACLSRQVGAAITDSGGDVLAIGWNDVPKVDGGLYTTSLAADAGKVQPDFRCYNWKTGRCFNDDEKAAVANGVAKALVEQKLLKEADLQNAINVIRGSRISHLIEFSRAIHAEMQALLVACQVGGQRVRGGVLYCTTYPCHACARHIVAAGIKSVFYIEPYRKSLATKLHDDAITEDEQAVGMVRLLPFDGVSPRRYLELFSMGKRKENGSLVRTDPRYAHPVSSAILEAIPTLEGVVVSSLRSRHLIGS